MSARSDSAGRAIWFARRPSGRGIRPVSWQGWATVIAYLAALLAAAVAMPKPNALEPMAFATPLIAILAVMGLATLLFVLLVRRRTAAHD